VDWTVSLGALLGEAGVDVRRVDLAAVAVRWATKVDFAGPVPEQRTGLGPCWIWTGARNDERGYGRMQIAGRMFYAHRVALALSGVVLPPVDELVPDHECLRPPCQRPSHLELVTGAENVRRHFRAQTTCLRGHPRTDENVYRDALGRVGYCRACKREKRAAGEWT
jgi:hypothetical protein